MAAGRMEILDIGRVQVRDESTTCWRSTTACTAWPRARTGSCTSTLMSSSYVPPPQTFTALLKEHEDVPYLTFGSRWWSVELCLVSSYHPWHFHVIEPCIRCPFVLGLESSQVVQCKGARQDEGGYLLV